MIFTTPNVFIIAETTLDDEGLAAMLATVKAPDWHSDGTSDAEILTEVAGKTCYMSFNTAINQNLTKTGGRSNHDYIQSGLIATSHGSTLEHATVTLAFVDVSRVLTHELVRHRAGVAYSQTSGRYVRSQDFKYWVPSCIRENPYLLELMADAFKAQERTYHKLATVSGINAMTSPKDFARKKELTSAFRRILGQGLTTNIIVTYNHRALRHVIEERTSRHAEEEIRLVFNKVFALVESRYPALYADASSEFVDGYFEIKFHPRKV